MAGGDSEEKSTRILADHVRAATFVLGDPIGVVPSNIGQGYILRRFIRRAIRHAKKLGIDVKKDVTVPLAEIVIDLYKEEYPELSEKKDKILNELQKEEDKFDKTLERGLKEFEKLEKITGKDAFNLFTTYGFPLELTIELARDKGMQVDIGEFEEEFRKHQELSRTASAGQFKGGLADSSDEVKRLHTAAHLMLAALRKVLGTHVEQRGSNITAERLRFDFSHPQKMTSEEIKKVEDLVNGEIKKNSPIVCEVMTVDEAKKKGAMGIFGNKYGEQVKVYSAGDFSKEICGGPHADSTGELGQFKIVKEEASSAGIRRIKAVLER
jgi:alanyl-tRNA synthetase